MGGAGGGWEGEGWAFLRAVQRELRPPRGAHRRGAEDARLRGAPLPPRHPRGEDCGPKRGLRLALRLRGGVREFWGVVVGRRRPLDSGGVGARGSIGTIGGGTGLFWFTPWLRSPEFLLFVHSLALLLHAFFGLLGTHVSFNHVG